MKNQKGIADAGIIIILGFVVLWIWRLSTYNPGISCEQYQEILNKGEHPKGIDLKDHFYHGHRERKDD